MKLNYTFSMNPPPKEVRLAGMVQYTYNEFMLDLPDHWVSYPLPDAKTLNFHSEVEGAAIIVSVQFYETPADKVAKLAEANLDSRIDAHEQQFPGQVEVLRRSAKPHSGGIGIEMSYVAEVPEKHLFLYVGYVTRRKILNLLMVCNPGREEGARLFNATLSRFRPKLP